MRANAKCKYKTNKKNRRHCRFYADRIIRKNRRCTTLPSCEGTPTHIFITPQMGPHRAQGRRQSREDGQDLHEDRVPQRQDRRDEGSQDGAAASRILLQASDLRQVLIAFFLVPMCNIGVPRASPLKTPSPCTLDCPPRRGAGPPRRRGRRVGNASTRRVCKSSRRPYSPAHARRTRRT